MKRALYIGLSENVGSHGAAETFIKQYVTHQWARYLIFKFHVVHNDISGMRRSPSSVSVEMSVEDSDSVILTILMLYSVLIYEYEYASCS